MALKKASLNKNRSQSEPSSSNPTATSEASSTQQPFVKCISSKEIRPGKSLEVDITISFEKKCVKKANSDIHIESLVENFHEITQWSRDVDHDIGIISSKTYITISPVIHRKSLRNSDKYETQQSSVNIPSKIDLEKHHSTQEDNIKDLISKPDSKNQVGSIQNLPETVKQEQPEFEQKISISVEDEYKIMSSEVVERNDLKEDSAITSTNVVQSSGIKSSLVSGVSELTEVINVESKVDDNDFTAVGLQIDDKNEVYEDLKLNSETHEDYDDDQQQQKQSQQILSTIESAENLEHASVVNDEIQATYTPQSVSSDLKDLMNKTDDEAINDHTSSKESSQFSRQETSVSHQKLDGGNEILNDAVAPLVPNEIKDISTELISEFTSNKDIQESLPSHVLNSFEVNDSVKPIELPQQIQVSHENSEYKLKSDSDLQLPSNDTTPCVQPYFESKTEAFNQIVEAQEELVAVYSGAIVIRRTSVISLTITDQKPRDVEMKFTASNKEWTNLAVDSVQSMVLDSCQITSQTPIKPIIHRGSYREISLKLPNNQLQTMTTLEAHPPIDDVAEDNNITSSHIAQFDDTDGEYLKLKEQPSTNEDVVQQQYKDNEDDIHTKEEVFPEKLSFRESTTTPVKSVELEIEISEPHEKEVYGAGMSEKDERDRELGEETDKDNIHAEEFASKREYTTTNVDESSRHDQPHLIIEQKCPSLTSISLDLPKKAMLPTIISIDSFSVPDITQVPPTFSEQRTHQDVEIYSTHLAGSEKSSNLRQNLTTDQIPKNQEVSYLPVGSELEISKFTQLNIYGQTTEAGEPIDAEKIVSENELQPLAAQNVASSINEFNQPDTPMIAEQTDTRNQLESIESEDKAQDIEMQKVDQIVLKNEGNNVSKIPTSNRSSCNQPLALVITTTFYKEVDSTNAVSERPSKEIQLFTVQSLVKTPEGTHHFQNIPNFQYSESGQSIEMSKVEGNRNDEKCDDADEGVDVSVYEDHELPNKEVNTEPLSAQFTPVNMPIQQIEAVDPMKITDDSYETELQKSIVPSETDVLENAIQPEISVSTAQTDKTNSIDSVSSSEKTMCSEQKHILPVSMKSQEQESTCKPTSISPTETQLKPPETLSGEFQVVSVPNVDTNSLKQESKSSFASQNSQESLDKYNLSTMGTVEQVVSKEQAESLAPLKGTESPKSLEINPISTPVKENVSESGVKSHHPTPYDTASEDIQSQDSMKTTSSSLQKELNESVEQEDAVIRTSLNQTNDKSKNADWHQDSNLPIDSDHEGLLTVPAADKILEKAKTAADTSMKVDKDEEKNKPPENVSQYGTASILSAEMLKSSLMTNVSLNSVKWNATTDSQILTDNNQLIAKLSVQFSEKNKLADPVQEDESTKFEMTINPTESSLDILYDDKSEIHQNLPLGVPTKQDSQSLSRNLQYDSPEKVHMNKRDPSTFAHQKVLGNSSLVFHTDQRETKVSQLEANQVSTPTRSRNQADYSPSWLKNTPDNKKRSSSPDSQIQSTFPERCESSNLKACCYCCQPSRVHFVCHCYCSQHHICPASANYCQTNTRAKSISRSSFPHCNCQMTPCTCDRNIVNDDNQYPSTFNEPETSSLKLQFVKPNSQECQTTSYENPTDSNLKLQYLSKSNPTICRCVSQRTVYCCCSQISNSTISIYCNRNPHHRNTTPYLSASISQIIPGHHCCCNMSIPKKHECASHVHDYLQSSPNNFNWS
ncbi:unnamed protein product [Trichobilharzia regenti]|uniref:CBM21 domain-containing protein n=1 Tax=Trichobilharzia regenti TaxID=157069 RepID=A0A183VXB3_TRIRE|nr:unnamed protein product [Trichobilharzia regenti]VDQ01000.1 unnamed protein product [Trichobilharzia regenti]